MTWEDRMRWSTPQNFSQENCKKLFVFIQNLDLTGAITHREGCSRNGFALMINQHRIFLVYFSDPIVFYYPPIPFIIINYTYLFICYLLCNKLSAINPLPPSKASLLPFSSSLARKHFFFFLLTIKFRLDNQTEKELLLFPS